MNGFSFKALNYFFGSVKYCKVSRIQFESDWSGANIDKFYYFYILIYECENFSEKYIKMKQKQSVDQRTILKQSEVGSSNTQYAFVTLSVPLKVKKTDLPVIPAESEILPSLDDTDDNFSDDLDDDEDLGKTGN